MQEDTRQNPANRPALTQPEPEVVEDNTVIQDCVDDLQNLMVQRSALEAYRDQVKAAGPDGLDPIAKQIMAINLHQLKLSQRGYGMESFDTNQTDVSLEDFDEWVTAISQKIKAMIDKLIELAKEYASRIMSGVEKVKQTAEDLIDRARSRKSKVATELHGDGQLIDLESPGLLWSNGNLCIGDCKSEQEVIKFFVQTWPKYVEAQITRAKKMISEYDVESGNSDNFEANIDFIGNHESLVSQITKYILPGNKSIAFKYVALGPELVDAEGATPAPDKIEYEVRPSGEIQAALKANIATMNALASMFKAEAGILKDMSTLSDALMSLENRRGETVWKSARESLDEISKAMMDLIGKLKPNYDPIVRHLAKVGSARNAICQRELEALGQ